MLTAYAPPKTRMRAALHRRYGGPDAVEIGELDVPEVEDDGVLVRVAAAGLNRADWYGLTGTPYVGRPSMGIRRPWDGRLGGDFAGTVEAVGKAVTHLEPGDEVFGRGAGSLAEYVVAARAVAPKPANVGVEEAATIAIAGTTALQALRDEGDLQPGQRVLVLGASGGVGTYTVQIAKALGGEVTAVCRTRNVELAWSLGADHVVDYTAEDVTRGDRRFDLVVDVSGGVTWSSVKRVLAPGATVVLVGGPMGSRLLGPLGHIARMRARLPGSGHRVAFFIAKLNKPDLAVLSDLVEAGKVRPFVERSYALEQAADAFRTLGEGHARGKLVVRI